MDSRVERPGVGGTCVRSAPAGSCVGPATSRRGAAACRQEHCEHWCDFHGPLHGRAIDLPGQASRRTSSGATKPVQVRQAGNTPDSTCWALVTRCGSRSTRSPCCLQRTSPRRQPAGRHHPRLDDAGDGRWEFREQQKNDPDLAPIPEIVTTASERAVDANAFLPKPIDREALLRVVKQHTRRA